MGLFDKKYCDVCGDKIGLLGNRKLEDGNLCKNCASKLSPWFTGRRHSALADIKRQLEDRDANKARVAEFQRSQKLGDDGRALYLDEAKGNFAVCYESDWKNGNPDIIPLSAVTSCNYESEEHRTERKYKDADGKTVSYNPPVYDFSYDYYIMIDVDHPYIDEIKFRVNNMTINPNNQLMGGDRKLFECEELCRQIVERLQGGSQGNAVQSDLTLEIPEVMAPFHAKEPSGAYDLVVSLNIKGSVAASITEPALLNENMAVEYIRYLINKTVMQLEQEETDVNTVTTLLNSRLMAEMGGTAMQHYGLGIKGTNLVSTMAPESKKMIEQILDARQKLAAMNTVPAPAAPASNEWVCSACGAKNESGKFCTFCGTPRA